MGIEPESVKSRLRKINNPIALRSSVFKDNLAAIEMDVRSVVENLNLVSALFLGKQVSEYSDPEVFYSFLLIRTLFILKEPLSKIENHDMAVFLKGITDMSCLAYDNKQTKINAIKYIKCHTKSIFPEHCPDGELQFQPDAELEYASLDFIIESKNAFDEKFFGYLCQICPNLIVFRFHELSSVFKKFPALFSVLLGSVRLDLNKSSSAAVLDMLIQEYKYTRYKVLIDKYTSDLYQKAEPFCRALSEENVLKKEPVIKSVYTLLQTVKSPKANDFSKYVNAAEELKLKVSAKMAVSVQRLLPELAKIWESSDSTLLELTHMDSRESHLDKQPDSYQSMNIGLEHCFTGILDGNFPDGNFPDEPYQHYLQCMEDYHSAYFLKILSDQTKLDKFSDQLRRTIQSLSVQMSQEKCAAQNVSGKMAQPKDGLAGDMELLIRMLDYLAENINEPGRKREIFCYSASMYLCSLTEKLLRLFYLYLVQGKNVQSDKTLGRLLINNEKLRDVFGHVHMLHLDFFLTSASGMKLDKSYRNRLAHWSYGMTSGNMTPVLVSSLLWLFTDVLNSVYIYFDGSITFSV